MVTNTLQPLPGELWVPVEGYEGRYEVSNRGRVWSTDRHKARLIKPRLKAYGHQEIQLTKNYKKWRTHVSTLVGRHFLPEYREGLHILHRDETLPLPERDWVENLWVGNQSENRIDCVNKGRHWRGNRL